MMDLNEECQDCPLCMEPLEMDDLNFYPCTCGYQICRFCWHRLRTDENGLCPACRKVYSESPADYKPLTPEELQKIKQEKKQKEFQRKQKVTESRKHLANVRVVQKNLVFVVGLSTRLADADALKKMEYFGKFGKIHKVVINHTTSYAGSQGPSASAYVTYQRAEDALKAIHHVNNIHVDGRTLKASLGTTKYCSHFMKNQQCPKNDCMYLHELGDEHASFTKEEMQQGKHQDFEKKLHDFYLVSGSKNSGGGSMVSDVQPSSNKRSHKDSLSESSSGGGGIGIVGGVSNSRGAIVGTPPAIQPLDSIVLSPGDGWPSLHTSSNSSNNKDSSSGGCSASVTSNGVAPPQGKKSRKHNNSTTSSTTSNNTSSNHSHNNSNSMNSSTGDTAPTVTTNGTSPRQTPTRDQHNSHKRTRNEDSTSSSSAMVSSETNSVASTSPPAASPPHTMHEDIPPPPPTTHNKHNNRKNNTASPSVNNTQQKRPKSQSPPTDPASTSSTSSKTNGNSNGTSNSHRNGHHITHKQNNNNNQKRHTASPASNQNSDIGSSSKKHSTQKTPTISALDTDDDNSSSVPQSSSEPDLLAASDDQELSLDSPAISPQDMTIVSRDTAVTDSYCEVSEESHSTVNGSASLLEQQRLQAQQQLDAQKHQHILNDHLTDDYYGIMSSINNTVSDTSHRNSIANSSSRSDWDTDDRLRQTSRHQFSDDIWETAKPSKNIPISNIESIDDELGFDPFEETNKALAEDIAMEKQIREEEQRQQLQQQSYQQLRQQQLHHQQQQQQEQQQQHHNNRTDLDGFFGNVSNGLGGGSRPPPPPGFNGISLSSFANNIQTQQQQNNVVDINKLLPTFISGLNSSSLSGNMAPTQHLNGLNRLGSNGPPPGLGLLSNLQGTLGMTGLDAASSGGVTGPGGGGLGGSGSLVNNTLLAALDPSGLNQPPPPPPGLSLPKVQPQEQQQPPHLMKDIENGVRNMFPGLGGNNMMQHQSNASNGANAGLSINNFNSGVPTSINSFSNNINGLSTHLGPLASLASLNSNNSLNSNLGFGALNTNNHQQQTQQQQNPLSALSSLNAFGGAGLNLASAQQHNNSNSNNPLANLFGIGQQQQQQQLSSQSLLHQLAMHNAQKGWTASATDLTALDPAIVSSGGQLTAGDSRSDSPLSWLQRITSDSSNNLGSVNSSNSQVSQAAWSALLNPSQHHQQQQLQQQQNTMTLQQHLAASGNSNTGNNQLMQQQQQQHQQQLAQQQQQQQQQRHAAAAAWPTSPPPGFSSISPLHQASKLQQQQAHNIDSESWFPQLINRNQ